MGNLFSLELFGYWKRVLFPNSHREKSLQAKVFFLCFHFFFYFLLSRLPFYHAWDSILLLSQKIWEQSGHQQGLLLLQTIQFKHGEQCEERSTGATPPCFPNSNTANNHKNNQEGNSTLIKWGFCASSTIWPHWQAVYSKSAGKSRVCTRTSVIQNWHKTQVSITLFKSASSLLNFLIRGGKSVSTSR